MAKHLENPTISSSSKKESIKSSLFFAGFSEACLHTHPWLPTLHQFHLNQGLDKPVRTASKRPFTGDAESMIRIALILNGLVVSVRCTYP